jgi:hypothetical protein
MGYRFLSNPDILRISKIPSKNKKVSEIILFIYSICSSIIAKLKGPIVKIVHIFNLRKQ